MDARSFVAISLVFSLLLAGCLQGQAGGAATVSVQPSGEMVKENPTPGEAMQKEAPTALTSPSQGTSTLGTTVQANENTATQYSGTVLAGSSAKLLDFTKGDFEAARASDKLVVLYFYADWCPICKEEFPKMQQAFNELQTEEVIGFRVNYKDSFTDSDEQALAREHGVPYQHTKVFLRNGERVLKSPEGWDTQRYLEEIGKALEG